MRRALLVFGLCLWSELAFAQQPVVTQPLGVTSLVSSGIIATTNTFQSVFAQAPTGPGGGAGRNGCTLVNEGTHTMYVYFGPIASATTPFSIPLPAISGAVVPTVTCGLPAGAVRQDQVSITGTGNDVFYQERN
jgi:hypothetical protein